MKSPPLFHLLSTLMITFMLINTACRHTDVHDRAEVPQTRDVVADYLHEYDALSEVADLKLLAGKRVTLAERYARLLSETRKSSFEQQIVLDIHKERSKQEFVDDRTRLLAAAIVRMEIAKNNRVAVSRWLHSLCVEDIGIFNIEYLLATSNDRVSSSLFMCLLETDESANHTDATQCVLGAVARASKGTPAEILDVSDRIDWFAKNMRRIRVNPRYESAMEQFGDADVDGGVPLFELTE